MSANGNKQDPPKNSDLGRRFRSAGGAITTFITIGLMPTILRRAAFTMMMVLCGAEVEDISLRIIKSFNFRHEKAIGYLNFTKYIMWAFNSILA